MTLTAPPSTALEAAEAFVRTLPSEHAWSVGGPASAPVTDAAEAFEAALVGASTVDVAVGFAAAGSLDGEDGLDAAHLVQPALAAAARTFGTGVLGEVRRDASLLAAEDATVLELLDESGRVAGWLATRERLAGRRPAGGEDGANLARINDVEMALTVEIGRTRMTVRDILNLEPGAVVELDRSAGAPADILLNGRIIAHGEVVVVDQDYAVRVTRILDAQDGPQ
ncbi:flagellar motor switch protein FliN [Agromyces sp. G08B096]|uniref:Flagellar motor switch protein FliN n=1 Tax=Agromyces sp. G08B096 TaxID=3156399 RepID=A0AAU7W7S6_9MICO